MDFVNNVILILDVKRPFIHRSTYFPNIFKPKVMYGYNSVIGHLVSKNQIFGVKHIWSLDNLTGIGFEIRYIKTRRSLTVKRLNFKQVSCMVFWIKKDVRWHLRVWIIIKCDIVFLQPSFEPFLDNIADNILLLDNDVHIAKIKADLPLYCFYFVYIEKPVVNFLCGKFN